MSAFKPPITDSEILELLLMDKFRVDIDTAELRNRRGELVKPYLIGAQDAASENPRRYAFGLRYQGRRRTIVRARLVYLAGSLDLIPEGFEIHHVDEDRLNDCWRNLIMVTEEDHRKLHNKFDDDPFGEFE